MDTLLSPRRRTLLQALGAAALVAGCGDRAPGGARCAACSSSAARRWARPTRPRSPATRLSAAARGRRARRRRRGARRRRATMSTLPDPTPSCRASTATPRRRLSRCPTDTLAVFALARDVSAAIGRRIRHHRRPGRRRLGLRPEQDAPRRRRGRSRARSTTRVGWRDAALDAARRHGHQGARRRARRPVGHRQGLRASTRPRARSRRSASPTT